MTKAKMMATMEARITELERSADHYRDETKMLYLNATGLHAGDMSTAQMAKTVIGRLKLTGLYTDGTKYDIEYMAEFCREACNQAFELNRMFSELFGMTVVKYRHQ